MISGQQIPNGTIAAASQAAPAKQRASWVVPLWFALCMLVGSIPLSSVAGGSEALDGTYVSQLLLLGLLFLFLIRDGGKGFVDRILYPSIAVIVLVVWVALADAYDNVRFLPEFLKIVLLTISAFVLWGKIEWRDIANIAKIAPTFVNLILVAVFALGLGYYYGEEGRFGVPWWGSPNSTAFVIAITIALQLYDIRRRWSTYPANTGRLLHCAPQLAQLLILIAFLIFTGSSGGLLSLGVILLRFAGLRLRTIFLGMSAALALVLVIGVELPELVGSGRPLIWEELIEDFYNGGLSVWIVGRGPGAIDLNPWFTASVQSAHSMYIEIAYSLGLPALFLMLWALVKFGWMMPPVPVNRDQQVFLEAVFGALVLGFFVDTYLMTAQLTWFGALILAGGALAKRQTRA